MKHEGSYYKYYKTSATESLPEVEEDSVEYARLRQQAQRDQFKFLAWAEIEILFFEKYYKLFTQANTRLEEHRVELQKIEERLEENPVDEALNSKKIETETLIKSYRDKCVYIKESCGSTYREVVKKIEELFEKYRESFRRSPQGKCTLFLQEEIRDLFALSLKNESDLGLNIQKTGHLDVELLLEHIKSGNISPHLVYKDLKKHEERMREYERTAERLLEEVKIECIQAVMKGVDEGWLPKSARENLQRLSTVKVEVIDRLSEPFSTTVGWHDVNGTVIVYSDSLKHNVSNELRSIIMHELVHEIAGSTARFDVVSTSIAHDSDDLNHESRIVAKSSKSGVQIRTDKNEVHFNFLNEALTEWLALRFSKYNNGEADSAVSYRGSNSYTHERRELDRLFGKGLEESLVLKAYFDNVKKGSKDVYLELLLQRINDLEGRSDAVQYIKKKLIIKSVLEKLPVFYYPKKKMGLISNTTVFRLLAPKDTLFYELRLLIDDGVNSEFKKDVVFEISSSVAGRSGQQELEAVRTSLDESVKEYPNLVYRITQLKNKII